jgi:putative serine protease PepD
VYPGQHGHSGYQQQQPYDWRYATQQQGNRQPHDPYRGAPQQPPTALPPRPAPKRSRAGALTAGALAIAVVSAGIGGGVALVAKPDSSTGGGTSITAAPSVPAASLPAGSVEQVAAKVVLARSLWVLRLDVRSAVRALQCANSQEFEQAGGPNA